MKPTEAAAIIRAANPWPLLAVANSDGENWDIANLGASAPGVDWSLTTDRVRCSEAHGTAETDAKALALMTMIGKPLVLLWEAIRQRQECLEDKCRDAERIREIDESIDKQMQILESMEVPK